jgi:hypothetical protein
MLVVTLLLRRRQAEVAPDDCDGVSGRCLVPVFSLCRLRSRVVPLLKVVGILSSIERRQRPMDHEETWPGSLGCTLLFFLWTIDDEEGLSLTCVVAFCRVCRLAVDDTATPRPHRGDQGASLSVVSFSLFSSRPRLSSSCT